MAHHEHLLLEDQFETGIRSLQRAVLGFKGRITTTENELELTKSALAVSEGKVRALEAELVDAKQTIHDLQAMVKTMKTDLTKLYTFKKSIISSLEEDKSLPDDPSHAWEMPIPKLNNDATQFYKPPLSTSPLPPRTQATPFYSSPVSSSATLASQTFTPSPYSRKYSSIPNNDTVDLIAQIDKRLSVEELSHTPAPPSIKSEPAPPPIPTTPTPRTQYTTLPQFQPSNFATPSPPPAPPMQPTHERYYSEPTILPSPSLPASSTPISISATATPISSAQPSPSSNYTGRSEPSSPPLMKAGLTNRPASYTTVKPLSTETSYSPSTNGIHAPLSSPTYTPTTLYTSPRERESYTSTTSYTSTNATYAQPTNSVAANGGYVPAPPPPIPKTTSPLPPPPPVFKPRN